MPLIPIKETKKLVIYVLFQKLIRNEIIYLAAISAKAQNDNTIESSFNCHKLNIQIAFLTAESNIAYIPQELCGRANNPRTLNLALHKWQNSRGYKKKKFLPCLYRVSPVYDQEINEFSHCPNGDQGGIYLLVTYLLARQRSKWESAPEKQVFS